MHVCIFTCCSCVCVCLYADQRTILGVILSLLEHWQSPWRQNASQFWVRDRSIRLDWLASQRQEYSCLCLPVLALQIYTLTLRIFMWLLGTKILFSLHLPSLLYRQGKAGIWTLPLLQFLYSFHRGRSLQNWEHVNVTFLLWKISSSQLPLIFRRTLSNEKFVLSLSIPFKLKAWSLDNL